MTPLCRTATARWNRAACRAQGAIPASPGCGRGSCPRRRGNRGPAAAGSGHREGFRPDAV